ATHALAQVFGPTRWFQGIKPHLVLEAQEITDLVDHAAHGWRVLQLDSVVEPAQSKAAYRGAMAGLRIDRAAHERHFDGLPGMGPRRFVLGNALSFLLCRHVTAP